MNSEWRWVPGRVKGYVLSHLKAGAYALAYGGLLPAAWRRRLIARFWESKAEVIHAEWGGGKEDYGALGEVLRRYRPDRLLDAGCGSGRLFPLYQQCGVGHVVGVDLSETALDLARRTFPNADLRRAGLTELDFADGSFDLCVCNRVLQHIPADDIRAVVGSLSRMGRRVYVNELTDSDRIDEAFFMRRHDYRKLFTEVGLDCLESGLIGKQTYFVFGRTDPATSGRTENH